ncbi:RNA polymerase sigma factor [Cupriavidus basilensis]|uniref:RNA polymerase sigma factor n=1 Tax=Cupriavidus basilensis TaxID=68895 RepID=A0ABT6AY85_9BURK|nr:RNA polymerase sigma factor [Cupriavidus basilensis]MDF3837593.1 RNA polymerase sigma factor [Cupriavidus basilensis]
MDTNILSDPKGPVGDEAANGSSNDAQRRTVLQDFLAANYDHLRRRLVRHLSCPDLARECLHDAWLRLGEMAVMTTVQSPEAYVYRVACNQAVDRVRANRSWQYAGDADSELAFIADGAPGPATIVEARSDLAAVSDALERLPNRHRAVLVALRLEEQTRQQVATSHRLSRRRVDTLLRQALDYCVQGTDRSVAVGVNAPRRSLPPRRMKAPSARASG